MQAFYNCSASHYRGTHRKASRHSGKSLARGLQHGPPKEDMLLNSTPHELACKQTQHYGSFPHSSQDQVSTVRGTRWHHVHTQAQSDVHETREWAGAHCEGGGPAGAADGEQAQHTLRRVTAAILWQSVRGQWHSLAGPAQCPAAAASGPEALPQCSPAGCPHPPPPGGMSASPADCPRHAAQTQLGSAPSSQSAAADKALSAGDMRNCKPLSQ